MKKYELIWLTFFVIGVLLIQMSAKADTHYKYTSKLSPNDYLMKSREEYGDPVFDNFKVVDLGVQLGVGSDCGKVDFKNTLRASLQNMLDSKYFGNLGQDILASSPMLLTCYFSPTWCAILKHSQVNANWLSQMRLNQCSLIDKYTDSRTEDYYQERQTCVRKAIDANGGDLEHALESCRGNFYQGDLTNWAGSQFGDKASSNKLIDSSAKWAGLDRPESRSSLDLVKSLVGDTVVSKGQVSVEYGPKQGAMTPRTHLQTIEQVTFEKLCKGIVRKVEDAGTSVSLDRVISDKDLMELNPNGPALLVDKQTIRALTYMNPKQRMIACQKLSDAVAMTIFSTDINRSLDLLTVLSQNPNLPQNRRQEILEKRRALKESVELTISLNDQRNKPINNAVAQINAEGSRLQSEEVNEDLLMDVRHEDSRKVNRSLLDCADGIMCEGGGR